MLTPRPETDPPRWATVTRVDPVSGVSNVIEPPEEKKDAGWNRAEPPPRQWFNWFMRDAGTWLGYLAQQEAFAPINTLNIGVGGVAVLPEAQVCTGLIFALNADDTTEFALGFVLNTAGVDYDIITIASNVLGFGTITGLNVEITGGVADADLLVNSILFPVQVLNTP